MTITRQQVEAVIADADRDEAIVEICETNSRNRRVSLEYESALTSDEGANVFHIWNSGQRMATTIDIDVAVMVFNYYGSRELGPR